MLSLDEIKRFKALAAKYPDNVSSKIIVQLLGELDQSRTLIIKLRSDGIDRRGPFTDNSLMPFGQYKGELLQHVPPEYLDWWAKQPENSNREAIEIDVRFKSFPEKAFAQTRLKLYDYIHSKNGNGNGAAIQQEG